MIAVYRLLYPWDFLDASIASITEVVSKIYIFVDTMPWGEIGTTSEEQRVIGKALYTACRIAVENPKVVIMGDHVTTPINQFTHLINDRVDRSHGYDFVGSLRSCRDERFEDVMVIEPDMVFRRDQISRALELCEGYFRSVMYGGCMTRQIEIWKGLEHRVPERPHRTGVVFWRGLLPETMHQANVPGMKVIDAYVHNFGFAVSEETMRVKDSIAHRMSPKIGDCRPDPAWLDKWLNWKPGDRDLEISIGYQKDIPEVVPYPGSELPPLQG
jgi:hypothetical protein